MSENSCPVCYATSTAFIGQCSDFLLRTTDKLFNLFKCRDCGTVFISPLPNDKDLRSYYPAGYWWSEPKLSHGLFSDLRKRLESAYRRFVLQDHVRFVLKTIRRASSESQGPVTLLDVGCSGGTFLHEMARRGLSVKGLDFSEEAVAHARAVYQLDCSVGDLEQIPWKDEKFTVLTCFHVLEHVAQPRAFLRAARQKLAEHGYLVVQVPNLRSWQYRLFGVRWYGLDPPRHLVNYSDRALIRLLQEEGFEVIRKKRFSLRDDAPAWISSLFPQLDPLARTVRKWRSAKVSTESPRLGILLNFIYFLLVLVAVPLALLDSLSGRGATIMVKAKRQAGNSQGAKQF